jgi:hypothetical protein
VSIVRTRTTTILVVLLLVVALVASTPGRAQAFAPGVAGPGLAAGRTVAFGAGVATPVGAALLIGTAGYYGYRYYMDHHHLDETVGGAGTTSCFDSTVPLPSFGGSMRATGCYTILGVQANRWRVQVEAVVENTSTATGWVRLTPPVRGPRMMWWGEPGSDEVCGASNVGHEALQVAVGSGSTPVLVDAEMCEGPGSTGTHHTGLYIYTPGCFQSSAWAGCQSLTNTPQLDPAQRTTTAEAECINAQGHVVIVTETTPAWEVIPGGQEVDSPAVQCPPGYALKGLQVWTDPAPGSQGARLPITDWEQDPDVLNDSLLEECIFAPASDPCLLRVVRVLPDGQIVPCREDGTNCQDWWHDPDREARFRCMWGPIQLPLTECWPLARKYNRTTSGQIVPNPALIPPLTGTQPTTEPVIGTPTEVPTIPAPGTPGQPGTPPGTPDIFTPPAEIPEVERADCFPNGWGLLNPVEWVLKPVKCALTWAFVPSPATMSRLTDIAADAGGKAPFSVIQSFVEWFEPIGGMLGGGGGTCLHITVPILGESYRVVSTCDPGQPETIIMGWRPWLTVVANAWLVVPLAWWAWKQYAPGSQGVA